MSRVVLFGASGLIGSQVWRAMADDDRIAEFICPTRRECDLMASTVAALTQRLRAMAPDVVINCTGSLDGLPHQLLDANAGVVAKLLDAIAALGSSTRFVRIGSAGEYGPVPHGTTVSEDDDAAPTSAYGLSHLTATRLAMLARSQGRVDAVTLRVFNPIGPGLADNTVLGNAASQLRTAASTHDAITMGPLSAYRDFVDTRDVGDAVGRATMLPHLPHGVYNIASGRAIRTRDAVRSLLDAADFDGELCEIDASTGRSAAVGWMQADISRARDELGWQPRHSLAESVLALWAEPVHVG